MTITLAELRKQSRQRADMEKSKFVKDSELNGYINNSIAELHDLLSEAYGSEYFVKSSTISVVSGTESYNLPADFYELKGVDLQVDSSNYTTIPQFNFNERNRFADQGFWSVGRVTNVRYRLLGDKILFSPTPSGPATIRIWYVPLATKLVLDNDTLNDYNAYSEYVIVDAAIKMAQKEETDVSVLAAQKSALIQRIRGKSMQRDASKPESVSDIYAEQSDYWFWYGSD